MTLVDPIAVDGDGRRAPPGRVPLPSIQVLRGFAALAVVVYHTHVIFSQPEYGGIDVLGAVAGKGWTGVNFFFVLSGFIIPYAHHADIGRPARAGRYISRRLTRVYPIYWLLLTVFLAASLAGFGHSTFERSAPNLASAYLLVQFIAHPTPPLRVAWTLYYEMFFYAMFLLLILNRRVGTIAVGVWLASVVTWGVILGHDTGIWALHTWNLYFAMGALAYVGYRRLEGRDGLWLIAAGLALLTLLLVFGMVEDKIGVAQTQPRTLVLLGPPFALVLLGAALADRYRGWRPPALLALLGEASYAIYLAHSAAISALAGANHRLARHVVLSPYLLYAVTIILATAVGVAAHLLLERPMLRLIRRITDRAAPPAPVSTPSLHSANRS